MQDKGIRIRPTHLLCRYILNLRLIQKCLNLGSDTNLCWYHIPTSLRLSYTYTLIPTCHALNPGPTRLADPNRVRGARLRTGTLYLIFFFKPNWYLWVWRTSYNRIKISYTFLESHLQIQNCTFTFTNQSTEPTVMNPYWCVDLAVCGCLLASSPVPTRIKIPC